LRKNYQKIKSLKILRNKLEVGGYTLEELWIWIQVVVGVILAIFFIWILLEGNIPAIELGGSDTTPRKRRKKAMIEERY
jgi:hypothetical protein